MDEELKNVAVSLFKIQCLLFGKFQLSSEIVVDAYFDLATIFSYPNVLNKMCDVACDFLKKKNLVIESVCGVSYSGIPFAVLISNKLNVPLFIRNKEINLSPDDRRIVGNVVENAEVTIIEEVICSGTSTLQVIKDIEDSGMKVKQIFVMVDLEQGGFENLRKLGYESFSLFKISEIGNVLSKNGLINEDQLEDVRKGWMDYFVPNGDCVSNTTLAKRLTTKYDFRIECMKSKISQRLFQLMIKKKSNICVDLALQDMNDIINTANLIGPYICILCLHLNAYDDLNVNQIKELRRASSKHDFLLMDDSKLAEVDDILRYQLKKVLNIVDIVTVLPVAGESSIKEINSLTAQMPDKGIFLTASLLTEDSFYKAAFEKEVITLGLSQCKSLVGFLSHQNSAIPIEYVHMMSDMRSTGSASGKANNNYYSSKQITQTLGADVLMLFFSENSGILESVKEQQRVSWQGYASRFSDEII